MYEKDRIYININTFKYLLVYDDLHNLEVQ